MKTELSRPKTTVMPPRPLLTGSASVRFQPVVSAMAAIRSSGDGSLSKVHGYSFIEAPTPIYKVRSSPAVSVCGADDSGASEGVPDACGAGSEDVAAEAAPSESAEDVANEFLPVQAAIEAARTAARSSAAICFIKRKPPK